MPGRKLKNCNNDYGVTDYELRFIMNFAPLFGQEKAGAKAIAACEHEGTIKDKHGDSAYQMLRKPRVQNALRRFIQESITKAQSETLDVIKELGIIGNQDIRDFVNVDKDGKVTLKKFDEIGHKSRCIKSIKSDGKNVEFVLHDKLRALELLGDNKQLFVRQGNQAGITNNFVQIIGLPDNGRYIPKPTEAVEIKDDGQTPESDTSDRA